MGHKHVPVKAMKQKTYTLIDGLSEKMKGAIGLKVEDTFTCLIYGESGNGKTNMTVDLLKELKSLGKMLYISWEEGHGFTIQELINEHELDEHIPQLVFSAGESNDELIALMAKKKGYKIFVFDTIQFSSLTEEVYDQLKAYTLGSTMGKRKILIFISHVIGNQVDGALARYIKRDANIKIHVKDFVGIVTSRYRNKKNYPIWEDGAREKWGENYDNIINRKPLVKGKKPKPKAKASKKKAAEPQETEADEPF